MALPLAGLKPARGWGPEEWAAKLAEIGREHDGRAAVELEAMRAAVKRVAAEKGGRWPAPPALRALLFAALAKRRAETGGDSVTDALVVGIVLRVWRETGTVPGPRAADLRRRCRLVAVLSAEGGPPAERLRQAGHAVPEDLAGIGLAGRP